MLDGEKPLSELQVRRKLGEWMGGKVMHINTFRKALRQEDSFPRHPNPFGRGQFFFYWSEVMDWLNRFVSLNPSPAPIRPAYTLPPGTERRRPGRPRKQAVSE